MATKIPRFSIVIFSDDEKYPKVIHLTWLRAWVTLVVLATLILLSAWALASIGQFLAEKLEVERLRRENAVLQEELRKIESKIDTLELHLTRAKNLLLRLRSMTDVENLENFGLTPEIQTAISQAGKISLEPSLKIHEMSDSEEIKTLAKKSVVSGVEISLRLDKELNETKLVEQSVADLWQLLADRQALVLALPVVKPARGWISSLFGYRPHPISGRTVFHSGIDIAGNLGSPIISPANGIVTFAGYDEGYGKVVEIDHGYNISTRYAHLSQIYVKVGQAVQRFDVIGAIGNTGRSTGIHLHYEIRVSGIPRNPLAFILDENL